MPHMRLSDTKIHQVPSHDLLLSLPGNTYYHPRSPPTNQPPASVWHPHPGRYHYHRIHRRPSRHHHHHNHSHLTYLFIPQPWRLPWILSHIVVG
ncbi:hypothetical protein DM02DRAFT_30532 [Periconia macrospinosa]|uniref:Uncharacterized protein n=1 Tax=Periconia macrospinosa TaxID=97972 RepID=A0A2V1DKJ6_9PLEO|nr:hypothetical protein DM02DRAFT_30532 [Periconia macrospinosa]